MRHLFESWWTQILDLRRDPFKDHQASHPTAEELAWMAWQSAYDHGYHRGRRETELNAGVEQSLKDATSER
jgi:hypothetical protein